MLWIVGTAFRDFRSYLQAHDITYGIFANKDVPKKDLSPEITVVDCDYSSPESLLASAHAAKPHVSALLAAGYDNYVLPASILAQQYHVPGISLRSAEATTDKAVMRAKFRAFNPAISPDFAVVNSWQDIEAFIANHQFPIMLKPTNLMKSLYITKNLTSQELMHNYQSLVTALQNKDSKIYTMYPPRIIVEECMEGTMHTVAGFADAAGEPHLFHQIVDCITGHDVGKGENYIYSRQLPSQLSTAQTEAILEVSRQGVQALGLTSTMLHIELMLTAEGPKIIEIGARIGGYRTRMYDYATGIDMNRIMLDIAAGTTPTVASRASRPMAVIELFPDKEGEFIAIQK